MKKLTLILAATAFTAAPAFADDISGTVATSCTISGVGGAVNFTDMDSFGQATDVDVNSIDVFCNETATINFVSLNGHMAHDTVAVADPVTLESATSGFNAGVDYRFTFDTIFNNVNGFNVGWDTSAMVPGGTIGAPIDPVNVTGATLTYSTLAAANSQPVLAGTYEDTLTITITNTGL